MDATGGSLVLRDLSEQVIRAFFDAYNELGHGFMESVYEAALAIRLHESGFRVERQVPIDVRFHGQVVGHFRADMLLEERLLVEVKAVVQIASTHEAQLLNYLKATGVRLGLLFNFGPRPEFRRRIFS